MPSSSTASRSAPRDRRVEERVLRPVDLARHAVDRARRAAASPGSRRSSRGRSRRTASASHAREEAAGERRALAAVVPAAERRDRAPAAELGRATIAARRPSVSLRAALGGATGARAGDERDRPGPDGRRRARRGRARATTAARSGTGSRRPPSGRRAGREQAGAAGSSRGCGAPAPRAQTSRTRKSDPEDRRRAHVRRQTASTGCRAGGCPARPGAGPPRSRASRDDERRRRRATSASRRAARPARHDGAPPPCSCPTPRARRRSPPRARRARAGSATITSSGLRSE